MKIGMIILPIIAVISIGITLLTIFVAVHFIAKFW